MTSHQSPTALTTPATRKMSSGVRASCCPRHPPCAEVQKSTAGMANARMRRYGTAAATRSGELPMAPSTCTRGLSLVHLSAQLKRFVWDRGCA